MSYLETRLVDSDRNGAWDNADRTYFYTDASGKIDYTVREVDAGNDGTVNSRELTDKLYNGSDHMISEYFAIDQTGDGIYDVEAFRSLSYDSAGRILQDRNDSWDLNGNVAPDYSSILNNTYNASGQYVSRETVYLVDGANDLSAYRLESFTYNTKGLLSQLDIRDDALLDFDIGYRYSYNSSNQLVKVTYKDPFVFGDENYHNAETWKYSSNGRLAEHNQYAEFFLDSYVLEVKTKFSYDSVGNVKSELATGQDNSWHTIEKQLTEYTRDSLGREVSKLISVDQDLNNVWDADTKTLITTQYGTDGRVVYQSTDYNTGDGILEVLFLSEDLLVA